MIRRISSSASPTTTCRSFRRRRCERAPCNGRRQQRWGCRPTWACTTCWVLSSARLASASEFAESGTIRRSASETSLATSSVIIAFCVCVKQANFETSVLTSHSLKIRLASNMFFVFCFFFITKQIKQCAIQIQENKFEKHGTDGAGSLIICKLFQSG